MTRKDILQCVLEDLVSIFIKNKDKQGHTNVQEYMII